MKVRKYTARSSRDALRQVREDLGPDAVILANRMVKGGVEVMAMAATEMAAHQAATQAKFDAERAITPLEVREEDVVAFPGAPAARRDAPRRPWSALALAASETRQGSDQAILKESRWDPLFETSPAPATAATAAAPELRSGPGVFRKLESSFDPDRRPASERLPVQPESPLSERKPEPAPVRGPVLGLRPEPAPLTPPPVRRAAEIPAPVGPAVLRRRNSRVTVEEDLGHEDPGAEPPLAAAELNALASRHDPLMAALAEEVRSLGSMLGQNGQDRVAKPAAALAVDAVEDPQAPGGEVWMHDVMGELRSVRLLIEEQMGAMAFGEAGRMAPGKARVARLLTAAGFSAALIRKVTARLPENIPEPEAVAFVHEALRNNLSVAGSEAEILDQGGVFALVGPTGAGKTTTVAKLAARFVVRHGAENLALLTTDGYRIGGQEQLRIYGKILGVAVYAVKDAEDLRRTLGELRNRKLVLIDTVGLSQRDRLVAEQHQLFANCGTPVKRLLLLNATCHGDTLGDVVRAYRVDGLAGCILTKLDEAAAPGAALDVAIRQRLRVFYAADGQRVPEDLHLAESGVLVDRVLQAVPALERASQADGDFPFELPPVQVRTPARAVLNETEVAHG